MVFPLDVCTEREGILVSPPLLMRVPCLLDQDPTLTTSFILSSLLKGPVSTHSHIGDGASTYQFGKDTVQSTARKQHVKWNILDVGIHLTWFGVLLIPAVWLWANCFIFLCLSFLICLPFRLLAFNRYKLQLFLISYFRQLLVEDFALLFL